MILPIVAYGSPVLRKLCRDISPDHPGLDKLIDDMWETMYNSNGVGLAAPQINHDIRLFIMDSEQIFINREDGDEEYPDAPGFKAVFINARILEETGHPWKYEEGCLSIPRIREDVSRMDRIKISYLDQEFKPMEKEFFGITARIIQHEYDHIEGKLFIDRIQPLKRTLLKRKLDDISKGKVRVDYRMSFPK
jgi:peptide deformylase